MLSVVAVSASLIVELHVLYYYTDYSLYVLICGPVFDTEDSSCAGFVCRVAAPDEVTDFE